jgi:hypothetical protein
MGLKRADLSDRAQRRTLNTDAAAIGLVLNAKGRDQPAWWGPEANRCRTCRLLGAAGTTPRRPAIARRDSYARFCPGPLSGCDQMRSAPSRSQVAGLPRLLPDDSRNSRLGCALHLDGHRGEHRTTVVPRSATCSITRVRSSNAWNRTAEGEGRYPRLREGRRAIATRFETREWLD